MTTLRRLDLPDRSLALEWSGPAPEVGVLLLHGFGSSRHGVKIRALVERLEARGASWAALDATAHGDSSGAAEDLTLARLVDDLAAAAEHLRGRGGWTGRLVLAGSSLGGVTAAWTAAERVPDTAALFLIAPAMRLGDRILERHDEASRAEWERTGRWEREHRGWRHALHWRLVEDWRSRDHGALASRLPMPVTIVHGTEDASVPVGDAREFARTLPDARLVEIEGGDHRLHEHRTAIGDELEALLDRLP